MSRRLNTTLREVTHVVHIDMSIPEIMDESEVEMSTVENLEESEVEIKVQAGQLVCNFLFSFHYSVFPYFLEKKKKTHSFKEKKKLIGRVLLIIFNCNWGFRHVQLVYLGFSFYN